MHVHVCVYAWGGTGIPEGMGMPPVLRGSPGCSLGYVGLQPVAHGVGAACVRTASSPRRTSTACTAATPPPPPQQSAPASARTSAVEATGLSDGGAEAGALPGKGLG